MRDLWTRYRALPIWAYLLITAAAIILIVILLPEPEPEPLNVLERIRAMTTCDEVEDFVRSQRSALEDISEHDNEQATTRTRLNQNITYANYEAGRRLDCPPY